MGRVVIVHTRNDAAFSARVITYLRQRNFSVEARVVAASAPLNLAPDEVDHVCVVHASSLHEQPSTEEVVMRSQAARGSSGALSVIPILQALTS